jgi:transposase-like protein
MKYTPERREAILRKLLPPNNRPVAEVAEEEGISDATLYNWRNEARKNGQLLPDHGLDPEGWSSRDKFNAVLEIAALSESGLSEYCRKRGIYPEQIRRWRQSFETANDRDEKVEKRSREAVKQEKNRTRQLERELKRKEAALAETAALLTLRKRPRRSGGTRTTDQHPRSPACCKAG